MTRATIATTSGICIGCNAPYDLVNDVECECGKPPPRKERIRLIGSVVAVVMAACGGSGAAPTPTVGSSVYPGWVAVPCAADGDGGFIATANLEGFNYPTWDVRVAYSCSTELTPDTFNPASDAGYKSCPSPAASQGGYDYCYGAFVDSWGGGGGRSDGSKVWAQCLNDNAPINDDCQPRIAYFQTRMF